MVGKKLRNMFLITTSQNHIVKKQLNPDFRKTIIYVNDIIVLELTIQINFQNSDVSCQMKKIMLLFLFSTFQFFEKWQKKRQKIRHNHLKRLKI